MSLPSSYELTYHSQSQGFVSKKKKMKVNCFSDDQRPPQYSKLDCANRSILFQVCATHPVIAGVAF